MMVASSNLGSVDLMFGWLACSTKGALRAGILFNEFSSCAAGSCKIKLKRLGSTKNISQHIHRRCYPEDSGHDEISIL